MAGHIIITRMYYDDKAMFDERVAIMKKTLIPSLQKQQTPFIFCILGDNYIDTLKLDFPFITFQTNEEMLDYCKEERITIQTRHDSDDMMTESFTAFIQNVNKSFQGDDDLLLSFNAQHYDIEKQELIDKFTTYYGTNTSMFLTLINRKIDKHVYEHPHQKMGSFFKKKVYIGAGHVLYGVHTGQIMKIPIEERKKLRQAPKIKEKQMKVLAIAFVYNEKPFLPYAIDWYKSQGCDLYVIDNMSDDGTWEWLQEQGIPSHRFNTQDAFQLEWLQQEMVRTLHKIKPDWFLWFAPDLFHVFDKTIKETIIEVEALHYNQIKSPCFCFKNTGEEFKLPFYSYYKWGTQNKLTLLCSKYDKKLQILADKITIPNAVVSSVGCVLEYGACKPKQYSEDKLLRRKGAWQLGTPEGHGIHYVEGKRKNWIYDKNFLMNICENDTAITGIRKLITKDND